MLLRKAFLLSVNNWKVLIKALIFQMLILTLVLALCFVIFSNIAGDVATLLGSLDLGDIVSETVNSILDGSFDTDTFIAHLKQSIEDFQQAWQSLPGIASRVEIFFLIFLVMTFCYRTLVSISDVAAAFQLHEFMTANSERPFLWYFVKKQGECWRFICLQTLITLPLDFIILSGCLGIFVLMFVFMRFWAVIPAVISGVVLYSVRLSWFSLWLPELVSGESGKVTTAMNKGMALLPVRFWHIFWKTLIAVVAMGAISAVGVIFIENTVLKLVVCTLPSFGIFFLLKCVNMVEHFEATQRPYFYKRVDVEGTVRYNRKMHRKQKRAKHKIDG